MELETLGMGGEAAVVASHIVQLITATAALSLAIPWLCKRWRIYLCDDIGLLILSAGVFSISAIANALIYGSARIAHHIEPALDVWEDMHWLTAVLRVLPIAASALFLGGTWMLLGGGKCEHMRAPALKIAAGLSAVWGVAFFFLS